MIFSPDVNFFLQFLVIKTPDPVLDLDPDPGRYSAKILDQSGSETLAELGCLKNYLCFMVISDAFLPPSKMRLPFLSKKRSDTRMLFRVRLAQKCPDTIRSGSTILTCCDSHPTKSNCINYTYTIYAYCVLNKNIFIVLKEPCRRSIRIVSFYRFFLALLC